MFVAVFYLWQKGLTVKVNTSPHTHTHIYYYYYSAGKKREKPLSKGGKVYICAIFFFLCRSRKKRNPRLSRLESSQREKMMPPLANEEAFNLISLNKA